MEEKENLNEIAKIEEERPVVEAKELVVKALKEILPTDEFRELIQETLRPSIEYRLLRDEFTLLSARLEASFEGFRREISALASELKADYRILKEEVLSSTKEATESLKETTLNLQKSSEDMKEQVKETFSSIEEKLNQVLSRIQGEITETLQRIDIRTPLSEISKEIGKLKEELKISLDSEIKNMKVMLEDASHTIGGMETSLINKINEKLNTAEEFLKEATTELKETLSKTKETLEAQKLEIQTSLREDTEKLLEQFNSLQMKLNIIENKLSSVNTKSFLNLLLILLGFGGIAFIIFKLMGG
ncbi:MAG: hypothetical protein PWQ16_1046 [bacterium]|nr:MAG: hypothetical protein XD52_0085 [bacterium 42_11]MDK2871694.1 hypothetical protein [bacterium]